MNFSGTKLRTLRKEANATLKQIADAVGVTASAVSFWEKGRSVPSEATLLVLSNFLACEPKDLESNENELRAILRDDDGRIKHETRFDSAGNPYREHWNLELSPALWKRLKKCMEDREYTANEVDGYLQSLIAEDYRKRFLMEQPEKPIVVDEKN